MNANLAAKLADTLARVGPEAPALRTDSAVITYGALDNASARVADQLRDAGVEPGDRIGVMLPNVAEFAFIYYGALRAGATVVPMNPLLKLREVAFHLRDAEACMLVAWHGCAEAALAGAGAADTECLLVEPAAFAERLAMRPAPNRAIDPRAADDTAVILYTSGTTGVPKGAELTHANLSHNVEVVQRLLGLDPDDVILGALPLFHSFGQTCGLNAAVATGASLALLPRFDAGAALHTLARDRVTVFEGVPTMYTALLDHPAHDRHDRSALRVCVSGGAALPVEVLHAFEAAFGCIVLEGYGLSETSPVACFNHPDHERVPGSIGTPVEGVQLRLVDDERRPVAPGEIGEIAIRGQNVMKGYWRRAEATAEAIDADGWFHSGDMARVDAQGRYFIVDRKKDLIIRGGYNVYPREIEEVLHEHPAVREAAVVGLPHAALGEEVGAAVSLKDGADASPGDLRAFVRERVAAYKYPRHVWLVDALPKGPTGKILRREIVAPADVEECA